MMMKKFEIVVLIVMAGLFAWANPLDLNHRLIPQKERKMKDSKTEVLKTNEKGTGPAITIEFTRGEFHNHPLMVIWVEDTNGQYLQTLYISKSIATGIFNYGNVSNGRWTQGEVRRPAALPYWSHQRGIMADDSLYLPTPENPIPDAYTGATPKENFILHTKLDDAGPKVFNVLLEINQPWDWNEYWTNGKFPENEEYKTSAQPAVVYEARVDLQKGTTSYEMQPIGHSHYAGESGELFTDMSTLSTALDIAESIKVKVGNDE
ncbi:MAG: hypothetical protein KQI35_15215 [Bacteroidetes bacterium]|nr:hypothetical protein [Bacteroidota bacterium]